MTRSRIGTSFGPLLRFPALLFFFFSALFAVALFSPFAYEQFIRPRMMDWMGPFIVWHHAASFGAYVLTALSLTTELRQPATRWPALTYVLIAGAFAAWMLGHPVLPTLEDDRRSLVFALVFLVPPLWIGLVPHVDPRVWITVRRAAPAPDATLMLGSAVLAGIYVWGVFAAIALCRVAAGPPLGLSPEGWIAAASSSLLRHVVAAALLGTVTWAMLALARPAGRVSEYAVVAILTGGAVAVTFLLVVLPALAIRGGSARLAAGAFAAAFVVMWSGAVLRTTSGVTAGQGQQTIVDLWIAPLRVRGVRSATLMLVLVGIAAAAFTMQVRRLDWDFVLQKSTALVVSVLALAAMLAIARRHRGMALRAIVAGLIAVTCSALAMVSAPALAATTGEPLGSEVAFDRYAAVDPSFRLLREAVGGHAGLTPDWLEFLDAHSTIPRSVAIAPARIDFGPVPEAATGRPPSIFLFVIDSLRRDYLSPYNEKVTFTPHIARFAQDSVVFQNAFTRYGGTGLSVPAIWSGSMLIHKQYVQPFAPMNALGRLLDARGYHRVMSLDSVVGHLMPRMPHLIELDRGRPNESFTLCATLSELESVLSARAPDDPAVFAYTLPQSLHVIVTRAIRGRPEAPAGFYPPYVERIREIDDCFGSFLQTLGRRGEYDNSIIVLTSDHGDSLGESGQWGHADTLTPEVLRIPLIIHVPAAMRPRMGVDPWTPAFTTDITPTLYALLGGHPPVRDPMFGASLFAADISQLPRREHTPFLVASSYGPVFGILEDAGNTLYVVDGKRGRDYLYHVPTGERRVVTDATRRRAGSEIRRQITEIGRYFHYNPED